MRSDAFQTFSRADWARLRASTPLTLTQDDLKALRGLNEKLSLEELADIYLPLSRLLNLHVRATRTSAPRRRAPPAGASGPRSTR